MRSARWSSAVFAAVLLGSTVPAASQCLLNGSYASSLPYPAYTCCSGLIGFSVQRWDMTVSGNQISVRPNPGGTLPAILTGTIDCQAGTFTASASIPGGCTETYTLQGQIQSIASWTGTFSAQYTGADCSCFGGQFGTPCTNHPFQVSGTLPPTAVRPGSSAPSLARMDIGPNPFDGVTTIRLHFERPQLTSVVIRDIAGRPVATLVDHQWLERGEHVYSWDRRTDNGRRAAVGIYLVHLRTDAVERVAKLLVLD